jgi:hypothetical protein
MKRLSLTMLVFCLLVGMAIHLPQAGAVQAQFTSFVTDNLSISWWTVHSSGSTASGGGYSLSGVVGQPDAGALSGGEYSLQGGFWNSAVGATTPSEDNTLYLPFVSTQP